MDDEPVLSREEAVATMWLIADIAAAARRFLDLTGDDGEEEAPDDED